MPHILWLSGGRGARASQLAGHMWFIADIFQRYTTNFANACAKIASAEADATRRALDNLRARRERNDEAMRNDEEMVSLHERVHPRVDEDALAAAMAADTTGTPPVEATVAEAAPAPVETAAAAPATSVPLTEVSAPEEPVEAGPVVAEAAPEAPAEVAPKAEIPMGVRGDVVIRWLSAFAKAERREMPDLLEALRKDKKVRVPELQIICAEALGEPPQHRKKSEHLDVLRRHFVPSERGRMAMPADAQLAAN